MKANCNSLRNDLFSKGNQKQNNFRFTTSQTCPVRRGVGSSHHLPAPRGRRNHGLEKPHQSPNQIRRKTLVETQARIHSRSCATCLTSVPRRRGASHSWHHLGRTERRCRLSAGRPHTWGQRWRATPRFERWPSGFLPDSGPCQLRALPTAG